MDFRGTNTQSLAKAMISGDMSLLGPNYKMDAANKLGFRPFHIDKSGFYSFVSRLTQRFGFDYRDYGWISTKISSTARRTLDCEMALYLASEEGHERTCDYLLHCSTRTDIRIFEGYPLGEVLVREHPGCDRFLLMYGVRDDLPDDYAEKLLFLAAKMGLQRSLKALYEHLGGRGVDKEDSYGRTLLMIASQNGHFSCVLYLLDKGADACHADHEGHLAIHLATMKGNLCCVEALMPPTSTEALLKACYGARATEDPGWLAELQRKLGTDCENINIPDLGISLLHLAVEYNWMKILQYLLNCGLDPNIYVRRVPGESAAETALALACSTYSLHSEVAINILVKAGARFDLGHPIPLIRYLKNRSCSPWFLRFLIECGANPKMDASWHVLGEICNRPNLLLEWMVSNGSRIHDHKKLRDFTSKVEGRFRYLSTHDVIEAMFVLVRFLPAENIRCLYNAIRCLRAFRGLPHEGRYKELSEMIDTAIPTPTPISLKEQCWSKMREVLVAREDYDLQRDVPELPLPTTLKDYLLCNKTLLSSS